MRDEGKGTVKIQEHVSVGKSPLRVDATEKVTGRAVYIDDLKLSGMLYGKVLRSKYAHARSR
jgi:xanthine dehydrogenase molybdenum-binding subunit